MKKYILVLFGFIALVTQAKAQQAEEAADEKPPAVWALYASGGAGFPGGDMEKLYGTHYLIGGGFLRATRDNWIYGIEGHYLFGGEIKTNPLAIISTQSGDLLDLRGSFGQFTADERGLILPHVKFGRYIRKSIFKADENSGLALLIGAGYMKHWLHFQETDGNLIQIRDDYERGYDLMTNSLIMSQSATYMYMSRNFVHFFLSVEALQGWGSRRPTFLEQYVNENNEPIETFDTSFSMKFGLIVPIRQSTGNEFYFD